MLFEAFILMGSGARGFVVHPSTDRGLDKTAQLARQHKND